MLKVLKKKRFLQRTLFCDANIACDELYSKTSLGVVIWLTAPFPMQIECLTK